MHAENQGENVAANATEWQLKHAIASALVVLFVANTIFPAAAQAQIARPGAVDKSNLTRLPSSLDLSSTQASVQAPNQAPINILTGGTAARNGTISGGILQSILPGQLLTPAQYLAVQESMRGAQTLQIGQYGQAIGGYTSIYSFGLRNQKLDSLVVPQNVSMNMVGFGLSKPLNINGDVSVLGHLFALQNIPNVSSVLQMSNLDVKQGASISGSLPTGFDLGRNVFASAGLHLTVLNNLSNMGTISTPGLLSVSAGGNIVNQNSANHIASMMAQNINLVSGSGQFFNSGLIQAINCVNIDTSRTLTDLNFKSTSTGAVQAINGAINVRGQSYSGTGSTTLDGGNWLSKQLNFNSGQGALNVAAENISGTINANADSAHILANAPVLTLGDANISGDPTYVNAGGDIKIVGTISENENLAIVASGNITASGAAQIINHGHDVWLIAGAKVDLVSGNCVGCNNSSSISLPSGSKISSGYVQVSATGASGGNIDLATNNSLSSGQTVIDTSGSVSGTSGGKVTLVALANGITGGQILLPTASGVGSINSSGSGSGANGDVTVIAGASSGQGVTTGSITANAGDGSSSTINIRSAQAAFSGGQGGCSNCLSFDSSGTVTGGIASASATNSSITLSGQININNGKGGSVTVSAPGGKLNINAPITTGGSTVQLTGGFVFVNGDIGSPSDDITITTLPTQIVFPSDSLTQRGAISGTGLITAGNLTLNTAGAIGNGVVTRGDDSKVKQFEHVEFKALNTSVSGKLVAIANGASFYMSENGAYIMAPPSIYINNHSSQTSLSATLLDPVNGNNRGVIVVTSSGNMTIENEIKADVICVRASSNSSITLQSGAKLITPTSSGTLLVVADDLIIDGLSPGETRLAGETIHIAPSTVSTVINLVGGTGGLNLSEAELMSMSSSAPFIQVGDAQGGYSIPYSGGEIFFSASSSGGINLNGPLNAPLLQFVQSGDGNFKQNGFQLIATNVVCENGTAFLGAPGSSLNAAAAQSIQISGPLEVSVLEARNGSISGSGIITGKTGLELRAPGGSIGPLNTVCNGRINIIVTGNASISNVGDILFAAFSESGSVTLANKGNIELLDSAQLNFGYYHFPLRSFGVFAPGGISISQEPGNTFISNYNRIITNNSPIILNVNFELPSFSGNAVADYFFIDAGTSSVTIAPPSSNFPINILGGSTGMLFNNLTLQYIRAGSLILGSSSSGGGINLYGSVDFSNMYNVQFLQGANGGFNSAGQTITMGSKQLNIDIGGAASIGSIITTGTTLGIAAQSVSISGSVGSSADILAVRASGGNIDGGGQLTAANALFSATGGGINITLNGTLLDLPSNGGTVSYMTSPFAYMPPSTTAVASATAGRTEHFASDNSYNANTLVPWQLSASTADGVSISKGVALSLSTVNVNSANIADVKNQLEPFVRNKVEGAHIKVATLSNVPLRAVSFAKQSNKTLEFVSNGNHGTEIARVYTDAPDEIIGGAELLNLQSSEVFVSASHPLRVKTPMALVTLSKGALASIKEDGNCTYVRACSQTGSVRVSVNHETFLLNSGEELVVSHCKLEPRSPKFADGLARRNTKFHHSGIHNFAFSDFSILSLLTGTEHLAQIRTPSATADRQILARLLKTAASIDVVLKNRGTYSSNN